MTRRVPTAGGVALIVLALVAPGCGSASSRAAAERPEESGGELPAAVSNTRAAILAAAESGDYESLRALVEPDSFLSDAGFGEPDPVGRWRELGPEPLEAMGAVLTMPQTVRATNEGTLYEWPRFDADSSKHDLTEPERDVLLTFMTAGELEEAFLPELGYTGPRIGILADGTWWFFLLAGDP